jgi:hypothetical protein
VTRITALVLAAITMLALSAAPALAAKKPTPKLGRTVVVKPAGGSVLVKQPGKKPFKLKKPTAVRMGSEIDTLHGKVSLTSKKAGKGTQSGVFSQGEFKVTQRRSDGLTDLTLTGAGSACSAAAGPPKPIHGAAVRHRRLFGRAHGRFRTRGRNSSATVRGTEWLTEDKCNGSTVVRNESPNQTSQVETATNEIQFDLDPGQTATGYCNRFDVAPDTYCLMLLAQPADGVIGAGIITQVDQPNYALCVKGADGSDGCYEFPFYDRDADGWRLGVVACPVGAAGEYFVGWSLDYTQEKVNSLLYPVLSLSLDVAGPQIQCVVNPDLS